MKSFCEKHAFTEMKKRGNQIQILGRVLPSQQLQKDQVKCQGGTSCHKPVKWLARYISEMNIRVISKDEIKGSEKDGSIRGSEIEGVKEIA